MTVSPCSQFLMPIEVMASKWLIISFNYLGYWQCPIMNKALTNFSHVVAIKTTGNVYSYEAVYELNIKTKNYHDLITNEPFDKSDILTLQNPEDDAHIALRDINNFAHLKELREDNIEMQKAEGKGFN